MSLIHLNQTVSEPAAVRPFDLTDRGLLLGDGVFDTSLVVDGCVILRDRHFRRLLDACDVFGFPVVETDLEALADSAIQGRKTGALRLTVTRGAGPRGISGTEAMKPSLLASFAEQRVSFPSPPRLLGVSSIHRNPSAPSSRYKTLSYSDMVMGQRQAEEAGFDDALYTTPDGRVTCSSIANIMIRFGSRLVTPPLQDGVIAGVMRGWIMENAAHHGFEVSENSMRLDELKAADNVFLTNSLRLMVPIRGIDKMEFDPVLPTGLTELVSKLAFDTASDQPD
jgi:branched-chain amino acid aminotransferase